MSPKCALFVSLLSIALSASSAFAQSRCERVFELPDAAKELVAADLLSLQAQDARNLDRAEIDALNAEVLKSVSLKSRPVPFTDSAANRRVQGLDEAGLRSVIASIGRNPVIRNLQQYAREDVQIGYCFGKATYVHLALLKMGVDKDSIRKVWAVGSFGHQVKWQFHVATAVRDQKGEWRVLDIFHGGEAPTLERWFEGWKGTSSDGKLRLYVTDPQKFSVSLGTYDRLQLGLDLPKSQDWYKGFFKDLMTWFRDGDLADVGLKRLIPEKETARDRAAAPPPELRPRDVPPATRPLAAGEAQGLFENIARFESEMIRAQSDYQRAPTNSAAEREARQRVSDAATQMERLIGDVPLENVPWSQLFSQAEAFSRKYQLAAQNSIAERTYLRLVQRLHASAPVAFEAQARLENLRSDALLRHWESFEKMSRQAPQNSSAEGAYLRARNAAQQMIVESYKRELASDRRRDWLPEGLHWESLSQRAPAQTAGEKLYMSLRDLAFAQAIENYKQAATDLPIEKLQSDGLVFENAYQRASRGTKSEAVYDALAKVSFETAARKISELAPQLSPDRRAALKATYQNLYQRAPSNSRVETFYRRILGIL